MLWFIFGLLYSLFQAFFNELNRLYKIDSWQLNFLHCLFSIILLSPMVFFIWPFVNLIFIGAALVIASIITVGCQAQIFMASQHNGRVGSIFRPISIFVAFIFWIGLFPETAKSYMDEPLPFALILLSFTLMIFSIVLIRKNDIGWRTFWIMAPIGVLYGLVAVISKYVIDDNQTLMQTLSFTFVTYFFMFLFSTSAAVAKNKLNRDVFNALNIKAGVLIALASVIGYVFVVLSFAAAPNPAFTSVLGALSPVWIMIYHRLTGMQDNASPMAGLLMIIASILLILAAV